MSDINWRDPEEVTIPAQSAIALMETNDGEILIIQEGQLGAEDDIIAINKCNLPALIRALQSYLGND
ncbi:MAG: hypothetical protein KK482_08135 [Sinorhizobium meliloti]|nr:hypothetical protein [Sinorhizobium meliloti]